MSNLCMSNVSTQRSAVRVGSTHLVESWDAPGCECWKWACRYGVNAYRLYAIFRSELSNRIFKCRFGGTHHVITWINLLGGIKRQGYYSTAILAKVWHGHGGNRDKRISAYL